MAAPDHLQHEQLSMFMTPRDLLTSYGVNHHERKLKPEAGRKERPDEMWLRKAGEAEQPMWWNHKSGRSLQQSVDAEGVKEPIHLATSSREHTVGNGYHRVAAQASSDLDRLMPVLHHATLPEAVAAGKSAEYASHPEELKALGVKP